jgi:hypothetical protein
MPTVRPQTMTQNAEAAKLAAKTHWGITRNLDDQTSNRGAT